MLYPSRCLAACFCSEARKQKFLPSRMTLRFSCAARVVGNARSSYGVGAAAGPSFSDTPICISSFPTNTLALIGAVTRGRLGYRCQSGLSASVIQLFRNTGTASSYAEGMNEARQTSPRSFGSSDSAGIGWRSRTARLTFRPRQRSIRHFSTRRSVASSRHNACDFFTWWHGATVPDVFI